MEAKKLAKEQWKIERLQKEWGKAPKSFQLESDCEVEGEKKRGRMVVTLRSKGKGSLYQDG
jgi:hypothetical protein